MIFIDEMAEFYGHVMARLGLRFKHAAYTPRHLAVAGAGLVSGIALRRVLAQAGTHPPEADAPPLLDWSLYDLVEGRLPGPGVGQDVHDWSVAGLAFLGIVDAFTEPDPDF